MPERLQKILSARGIASRRKAEEMIAQGLVTVNGKVSVVGYLADLEKDEILVNGTPLPKQQEFVYILLNKPRGYVTTLSDEKGRRNAAQLVADCGERVYPVGRLDMDSEGLLLFTNDGAFANTMMHPKHEVDKTYEAWVTGFSMEALEKLKQPIVLDGYTIKKPAVTLKKENGDQALVTVTIHEGRNRQVRRMCAAAGLHVTRLRRVAEGPLILGDLPKGKWRYLTEEEIRTLTK